MTIDLYERVIARTALDPTTGCWEWQGATTNGYGKVGVKTMGKLQNYLVHRVTFEHHKGVIQVGQQVDHLCRNTTCVNPDHLEAVTPAENCRRRRSTRLTPDLVSQIRASSTSQAVLAKQLGVHQSTISLVRSGRRWGSN